MRKTFILILASLILVSVLLTEFVPFEREPFRGGHAFHPPDWFVTMGSCMPEAVALPCEAEAYPAITREYPCDVTPNTNNTNNRNNMMPGNIIVPGCVLPSKIVPVSSITLVSQPMLAQASSHGAAPVPPLPTAVPAPTSSPAAYFLFYTGVPVLPNPNPMVQAPMVQSFAAPVFVPQVVSSRVGPPRWVYSNGVVIKPKVYYPRQPLRNSIRGVTP